MVSDIMGHPVQDRSESSMRFSRINHLEMQSTFLLTLASYEVETDYGYCPNQPSLCKIQCQTLGFRRGSGYCQNETCMCRTSSGWLTRPKG